MVAVNVVSVEILENAELYSLESALFLELNNQRLVFFGFVYQYANLNFFTKFV
jgi:hypothetical protein